jgi:hypothetical protein
MPGKTIPVFSMRSFDFSNLSTDGKSEIIVTKGIHASPYTEGKFLVRVHSGTVGGTATITIRAATWAPCSDDPSNNNNFIGDIVATATVDNSAAMAAPNLATANLTSNFGGQLLIAVCGNQSSTAEETITAVLSAELVLKD